MRTFDLFALPTRAEPFGKVVVEAMAAGCPVLASRVGGIPEIISDKKYGTLIDPESESVLATSIIDLLENRDRARAVAEAGRQRAFEEFSLDGMMFRLQDVYDLVLARHRRSRAA
jgi:glycosyltransferase involved in cell wall biosynthesis